jgi:predicted ester cyclase
MLRRYPLLALLVVTVVMGGALGSGGQQPAAARQASPVAGTPCPATTEDENAALVRRYLDEAYNQQDLTIIDDYLVDDFIRHSTGSPHVETDPHNEDDVARVQMWLTAFPDLNISIEKLVAADDLVIGWLIWSGTNDGPLPYWGGHTTGQSMERESITIWRIECGQIAENWIVQDNLTMLQQLGVISDDELATAATPTAPSS